MAAKKDLLDYKTCSGDDIIQWCVNHHQVDWLQNTATYCQNFFSLRKAFFTTYMPEAMPKAKAKPETLWDKIANLKV